MDEPRRNDAFERELRRTLAGGGGASGGPHLDAELAAAWMDRQLDASAARSIEAHLADCPDCQAMMAALARIPPEGSATGEGVAWWRRLRAGWLVPATVAAAAALVIWVALPQQRAASKPESVQALSDRAPARDQLAKSQPDLPAATEPSAAGRRLASPPSEVEKKAVALEAPPPPPLAAPAPAAPPAPELERRNRADAAAPASVESLKETITVDAQQPVVDVQATGRSTVVGQSPARAGERQEAGAPAQGRFAASLRASSALVVTAADGARWRRAGTALEFAPRAGAAFTAVTLPASADAIAAGASPGGTVCWLVGDGGLVLLSVDGIRFVRVSAPAALDLAAVAATDARTAVVTAATGRRFRTTDQGASWTPVP